MVFSYHLTKHPYQLIYKLLQLLGKTKHTVFYCREIQDWDAFEPVQRFLKPIDIVTNKTEVRKYFRSRGVKISGLPAFPKAVIMARHSCYKFPSDDIIKIGMRHGPYHFKKMTKAENYNQFDRYLMTSTDDVNEGCKAGITCAVAVGYPKLDPALNRVYSYAFLADLKDKATILENKHTILFSATWLGSGMSALLSWYHKLHLLTDRYNVIVTLHPWIEKGYRSAIEEQGVYLISGNHIPYISLADVVVGDTSSLLAEACALNKPIITWKTDSAKRYTEKIDRLLQNISIRVENWDELLSAIERSLAEPGMLDQERKVANNLMFDELDGRAGWRAAQEITYLLPELKP